MTIINLQRKDTGTNMYMDNLTYNYISGTNKLSYFNDALQATSAAMSTSDLYAVYNYTNGVFAYSELLTNLSNTNSSGQLAAFFQSSSNSNPALANNIIKNNYPKNGLISLISGCDPTNALTNILSTQTYSTGVNSMLAYAYADMQDYYAIEQYIADAQSYFSGLSSSGLEIANLVYHQDFALGEHHIYGSSRVGVRRYKGQTLFKRDFKITGINSDGTYNVNTSSVTNQVVAAVSTDTFIYRSGITSYELTNHLGNVMTTITDKKVPVTDNNNNILYYKAEVVTATDYYPFGMQMPERNYVATDECGYRFAFNGKEGDDEVSGEGNFIDYGMRINDTRLARFFSVDPITKNYPMLTPYQFASNSPICSIDLDGMEGVNIVDHKAHTTTVVLYLIYIPGENPSPVPPLAPSPNNNNPPSGTPPASPPENQGTPPAPDPKYLWTQADIAVQTTAITQEFPNGKFVDTRFTDKKGNPYKVNFQIVLVPVKNEAAIKAKREELGFDRTATLEHDDMKKVKDLNLGEVWTAGSANKGKVKVSSNDPHTLSHEVCHCLAHLANNASSEIYESMARGTIGDDQTEFHDGKFGGGVFSYTKTSPITQANVNLILKTTPTEEINKPK